jgi:TAG lipase/steryl ester hydrolase/phospholipase A2/LPA acyltransferase
MKVSDQYEAYDIAKELLEQATNLFIAHLPEIKHIASEVTEILFVPKAITKQLVLAIALETGVITIKQVRHVVSRIYSNFSSRSKLIRQLQKEQNNAQTQDEWMEIADQIDTIQGNDLWRSDPNCPLYESDRISARIDEFVHLMRRNDIFDLMFTLRGGIARNKFGLLHEGLFSKALAGTKVLVETYHNVICTALDIVCDSPTQPEDVPIPTDTRLAFFNEIRYFYGRIVLMLSGGAAFGFYHVGVVKALMENGLLPRVISGASAGSIVCAMIGTRTDDECREDLFQVKGTVAPGHHGTLMTDFFRPLQNNKRSRDHRHHQQNPVVDVLHNTAGAFADGKRTWQVFAPIGMRKFTSFLYDIISGHKRAQDALKSDTDHFRECCRINIGNFTFQEAFDRTGRILNIIVSPQNRSDPPRLLNYLTSPHVLVWTAAVASSSLPGVFEPNKLLVKDADGSERYETSSNHHFIDGSMEADLPMQQLSEMFNINHFIISQANPHAVVLASFNINKSIWANKVLSLGSGILLFLKNQVKQWFVNMIELIGGQRAAPLWDTRRGFFSQFFTQEYEGRDIDISLVPWSSHRSVFSALLHCIYNPSEEDFLEWIHAAECETWRYIPKIKSHVAVEMTLDRCVQRLRQRLLSEHHSQKSRARADTTLKMSARVPSL